MLYVRAHNLSCPASAAMTGFKLNARPSTSNGIADISFNYGCEPSAGITTTVTTNSTRWVDVQTLFTLDPLNIACPGANQAFQAWRFDAQLFNLQARLSFRCVQFLAALSCIQRTTAWQPYVPGDFTALQLHDVRCESHI